MIINWWKKQQNLFTVYLKSFLFIFYHLAVSRFFSRFLISNNLYACLHQDKSIARQEAWVLKRKLSWSALLSRFLSFNIGFLSSFLLQNRFSDSICAIHLDSFFVLLHTAAAAAATTAATNNNNDDVSKKFRTTILFVFLKLW